ncbi:unnamed protein product, partial [Polarella glacialis]
VTPQGVRAPLPLVGLPLVGLPLGAPPSAAQGWDGAPGDQEDEDDGEEMGAWRAPRRRLEQESWRSENTQDQHSRVDSWRAENREDPSQEEQPEDAGSTWNEDSRRDHQLQQQPQEPQEPQQGQELHPRQEFHQSQEAQPRQEQVQEVLRLPEALWSSTDVVRALCFQRPRRFLLATENELMRLLRAPQGAVLRMPALAPHYRCLLHALCLRFHMGDEESKTVPPEILISTTSTSLAPVLPLAALVPHTWAGSSPSSWEQGRSDPWMKGGAKSLTPCPGLRIPAACDLTAFAPGTSSGAATDGDIVAAKAAASTGAVGVLQHEMRLMPGNWEFLEPPWPVNDQSRDGGGFVVTFSAEEALAGGGVAVALCEAGGGAREPLQQLLARVHGQSGHFQRRQGAGNFHVLLVEPAPAVAGQEGLRWSLRFGGSEGACEGRWQDSRTLLCAHSSSPSRSSSSSTFWVATYADPDGHGVLVEAGVDRFPWRRVFRAKAQYGSGNYPPLRQVAMAGLSTTHGMHLSALSLETCVCPDLASRDHVVQLTCVSNRGGAAERSPWWMQPGRQGLVAVIDGLAVCESPDAAYALQNRAATAGGGGWEATTLAQSPLDDDASESSASVQRRRATTVAALGQQAALELGLHEWVLAGSADGLATGLPFSISQASTTVIVRGEAQILPAAPMYQAPARSLPPPPATAPPTPPVHQQTLLQQLQQPHQTPQAPQQTNQLQQFQQLQHQLQQQNQQQQQPLSTAPFQKLSASAASFNPDAPSFNPEAPAFNPDAPAFNPGASSANTAVQLQQQQPPSPSSWNPGLSVTAAVFTPGSGAAATASAPDLSYGPVATGGAAGSGGGEMEYGYPEGGYAEGYEGYTEGQEGYYAGGDYGYEGQQYQTELSSDAAMFVPGAGQGDGCGSSQLSASAQEFAPGGAADYGQTGSYDDQYWGEGGGYGTSDNMNGRPGQQQGAWAADGSWEGKGASANAAGKGWSEGKGWQSDVQGNSWDAETGQQLGAKGKGWEGGSMGGGGEGGSQRWDGGPMGKGGEGGGGPKGKGWESGPKGKGGWEGGPKGKGWEGGPKGKYWESAQKGKGLENGKSKGKAIGKDWEGKGPQAKGWQGEAGAKGKSSSRNDWQAEAPSKGREKDWEADGDGHRKGGGGKKSGADDWDDRQGWSGKGRASDGRNDDNNANSNGKWENRGWKDEKWEDKDAWKWKDEWKTQWRGDAGKGGGDSAGKGGGGKERGDKWKQREDDRREDRWSAQGTGTSGSTGKGNGAKGGGKASTAERPPMRRRNEREAASESDGESSSQASASDGSNSDAGGRGGKGQGLSFSCFWLFEASPFWQVSVFFLWCLQWENSAP